MSNFRKHIEHLYPKQTEETILGIHELIDYYSKHIEKGTLEFSNEDVILIAYADSFQEDGRSHLESLHKIANKYLLGLVNSIHILPFYPYTSDDGFSVVDYKAVNPEFGDWSDIEKLGEDFYLMFDAVINHISKSSDWFQSYLRGDEEYKNFFIEENPQNTELKKVIRPRTLPLLHPFNKQGQQTHIWTTFSEDQIDLNYSNPLVFLKVLDVLLFYISKGARLIRLDAIAFLWKQTGTHCIHLKETHYVVQLFRSILEHVAPQTILITETNVPHGENISYFGNGYNEAHMVYNFTLPPLLAYSIHANNVEILVKWAQSLQLPSDQNSFFNFTASHDGIGVRALQGIIDDEEIQLLAEKAKLHGGFVSYKSNPDGSQSPYELNCNYMDLLTHPSEDIRKRAQRFMLTQAVALSIFGIPGIYYHSLFGSENDIDGALNSGINRRINREKIKVEELVQDLENPESLRSLVFNEYKKLLEIRRTEIAFTPQSDTKFSMEGRLFVVERSHQHSAIVCLFNFSDKAVNIEKYSRQKTNLTYWKTMGSLLEPNDFIWLSK